VPHLAETGNSLLLALKSFEPVSDTARDIYKAVLFLACWHLSSDLVIETKVLVSMCLRDKKYSLGLDVGFEKEVLVLVILLLPWCMFRLQQVENSRQVVDMSAVLSVDKQKCKCRTEC